MPIELIPGLRKVLEKNTFSTINNRARIIWGAIFAEISANGFIVLLSCSKLNYSDKQASDCKFRLGKAPG